MQIYLIEGKLEYRLPFLNNLSKDLSKDKRCLLISFKRNTSLNLEDIYDMEGMITYDICDHFLNYVSLENVINKADENIDFIIAPLLEDKYEIKKDDINKLIEDLSCYDYFIFDNLAKNMIENKKTITIVSDEDINKKIDADYFFIEAEDGFDERIVRNEILEKSSKFLGVKRKNEDYIDIINNLKDDKKADIEKLSFIEKIKMKFKK